MKKKILLILAIVISLALGFVGGFNLGKRSIPPQVTYRIDPDSSKLIDKRYFNLTGLVAEIDYEKNILTLTSSGESAKINVQQGISVTSFGVKPGDSNPNAPKTVGFNDIKIGDKVSVYAEVAAEGKLLGKNVYIHFVPVQ